MKKSLLFCLITFQALALDHQIRVEAVSMNDHRIQQMTQGIRLTNTFGLVPDQLSAEVRLETVKSQSVLKPYYWQNVQFLSPAQNTPALASLSLIKHRLIHFSDVEINLRGGYRQIFSQVNDPGFLVEPCVKAKLGALTARAGYEFSNSVRQNSDAKYNVRRVGADYHLTPAVAVVVGYELQRGFLNRTAWTFGSAYQPQNKDVAKH